MAKSIRCLKKYAYLLISLKEFILNQYVFEQRWCEGYSLQSYLQQNKTEKISQPNEMEGWQTIRQLLKNFIMGTKYVAIYGYLRKQIVVTQQKNLSRETRGMNPSCMET